MSKNLPSGNEILAALPRGEYERLLAGSEIVHLPRMKNLHDLGERVRHVYFPNSGVISLICITEEGEAVQVAVVGSEGVVGVELALGFDESLHRAYVQLTADALRIKAEAFKVELNRGGALQELLSRYAYTLINQISQAAICNRFHTVEQRLCRWLLVTHDRAESNTFHITQECIAHILGAPRTGVTMAARVLQNMHMLRYSRGKITILDRSGLENAACECYRVVKNNLHSQAA